MTIRKVGLPRPTNDNLLEVVSRLVEAVGILQGTVGNDRAVRLSELSRAQLVATGPTGGILIPPAAGGTQAGNTYGDSLTEAQVKRLAQQASDSAVGAHVAAADPHTQYLKESELVTTSAGVGSAARVPQLDSTGRLDLTLTHQSLRTGIVGATFDGGQMTPEPGVFCDVRVPYRAQIVRATLLSDDVTSAVVDVRRTTLALYPAEVGDSICGASKPTLASDDAMENSTLTGWNTTIEAGDILRFVVESNTLARRLMIALELRRI